MYLQIISVNICTIKWLRNGEKAGDLGSPKFCYASILEFTARQYIRLAVFVQCRSYEEGKNSKPETVIILYCFRISLLRQIEPYCRFKNLTSSRPNEIVR